MMYEFLVSQAFTQCLGFLAGGLIMLAALPQILRNIRNPHDAGHQSLLRNVLFVAGNVVWIGYGIRMDAAAITVMCAANVILNGIILSQMLMKRPTI